MTDLSHAFDCVENKLLIAKRRSYCLDLYLLKLIHSYLNKWKQKVKINNAFSAEHGLQQEPH